MEHEKFALTGAFLLLLCSIAFAIPSGVQVSVSAPASFGEGDTVYFDYTITSPSGGPVSFLPMIACDGNAVAPLREMNATLNASSSYAGRYYDFKVGELTKPGSCVASIVVLDSGKPTQNRASASFAINTLPVLETRFFTCADAECMNPKKVFVSGETVYIRGTAKDGGAITVQSADAQFTDGRATMGAQQPGYRSVSVVSSSPSYKHAPAEKVQYAVIPNHPRIGLKNFNVKDILGISQAIKDSDTLPVKDITAATIKP